nr:MAG TPA: hypothetical protein [Caudoviricetes sp.]
MVLIGRFLAPFSARLGQAKTQIEVYEEEV